MSIDKPKRPGAYAAAFHHALEFAGKDAIRHAGESSWQHCLTLNSREAARREMRRFRAFVKGLKHFPLHKLAPIANDFRVRTRLRELPQGAVALEVSVAPKEVDLDALLHLVASSLFSAPE